MPSIITFGNNGLKKADSTSKAGGEALNNNFDILDAHIENTPKLTISEIDPSVNDDENSGFVTGKSIWFNSSTQTTFILVDAAINNADWRQIFSAAEDGSFEAIVVHRRDSSSNLEGTVPLEAEIVYATDTKKAAVGDGTTAFENLLDFNGGLKDVTATPEEINQALDGINLAVSAVNLNQLTAGALSHPDALHTHTLASQEVDGEASFRITNGSSDSAANQALRLAIPQLLPFDTVLQIDKTNGFFNQSFASTSYNLVGTLPVQQVFAGDLTSSISNQPIGSVPIKSEVLGVVLTLGSNLETDNSTDGISLNVKINGTSVLSTQAEITVADGSGSKNTESDGTSAVVKSDGSEQVEKGDYISADISRTVSGSLTSDAKDIVVLVILKALRPS